MKGIVAEKTMGSKNIAKGNRNKKGKPKGRKGNKKRKVRNRAGKRHTIWNGTGANLTRRTCMTLPSILGRQCQENSNGTCTVRMPHIRHSIKEAHDQRSETEKGIAGIDGEGKNRALKT